MEGSAQSVVVGLVVKGEEWHPSPALRSQAHRRARTVLDRDIARLGLRVLGEPHVRAQDDGWGGILLTVTADAIPA